MPSITIVIPVYNEEENIEWVLKDTLRSLPKFFKNWEIITVDDGSSDKTGPILEKIATRNSKVKVIHQKNGGYSKAMLSGIKAATKDYIAYMPADGQFLISDMRHCFKIMSKNDLVLGYRGSRPDYTSKRIIISFWHPMDRYRLGKYLEQGRSPKIKIKRDRRDFYFDRNSCQVYEKRLKN